MSLAAQTGPIFVEFNFTITGLRPERENIKVHEGFFFLFKYLYGLNYGFHLVQNMEALSRVFPVD